MIDPKDEKFQYAIGYALEGLRELIAQEMQECYFVTGLGEPLSEEEADEYITWLIYTSEFVDQEGDGNGLVPTTTVVHH